MKVRAFIAMAFILCLLLFNGCAKKDNAEEVTPTDSAGAEMSGEPSAEVQPSYSIEPRATTEKFIGKYKGYNTDTGLTMLYLASLEDGQDTSFDRRIAVFDGTPIIDAQTGKTVKVSDIKADSLVTAYTVPLKSLYDTPLGKPYAIFVNVPENVSDMPAYIKAVRITDTEDGDIAVLNDTKDMQAIIPKLMPIEILGSEETALPYDIKTGSELFVWFDPQVYPPYARAARVVMLPE